MRGHEQAQSVLVVRIFVEGSLSGRRRPEGVTRRQGGLRSDEPQSAQSAVHRPASLLRPLGVLFVRQERPANQGQSRLGRRGGGRRLLFGQPPFRLVCELVQDGHVDPVGG